MNVFDFDGTILRGDSTLRFTLYCAFRYKGVLSHVLKTLPRARRMNLTEWKQALYGYFALIPDMDKAVSAFWDKNIRHVYPWYRKIHSPDDVVISASPEFLVREGCARLGITRVHASPVDKKTGRYSGPNCSREEKVRVFRRYYGGAHIDSFYSDSHKDDPLAGAAEKAYLIKRGRVLPWH